MNDFWKAFGEEPAEPAEPDSGLDAPPNIEEADEANFEDLTEDAPAPEPAQEAHAASRRRRHEKAVADESPVAPPPDFGPEDEAGPKRAKWPIAVLLLAPIILLILFLPSGGDGSSESDDPIFVDGGQLAINSYQAPAPLSSEADPDTPDFTSDYRADLIAANKLALGDAVPMSNYFPTDAEIAAGTKLLNQVARVILNNDYDGFRARESSIDLLAEHLTSNHLPFTVYADKRPPIGSVALISNPGSETLTLLTIINKRGYPLMKSVPIGPIPKSEQAQFYITYDQARAQVDQAKATQETLAEMENYLDDLFRRGRAAAAQYDKEVLDRKANAAQEAHQENLDELEEIERHHQENLDEIEKNEESN